MIKRIKSSSVSLDNTNDNPAYWSLEYIRNSRNAYLILTDKYLLPDYPITPENLEIVKNYRQYLRNFININKDAILNGENIEIEPLPAL